VNPRADVFEGGVILSFGRPSAPHSLTSIRIQVSVECERYRPNRSTFHPNHPSGGSAPFHGKQPTKFARCIGLTAYGLGLPQLMQVPCISCLNTCAPPTHDSFRDLPNVLVSHGIELRSNDRPLALPERPNPREAHVGTNMNQPVIA
jgi:hypothetical protein